MKLFLTKVWEMTEPAEPLMFGMPGARDAARAALGPEDMVVLAATMNEPTSEATRGRLLGLVQPTTEPVHTLDYPVGIDAFTGHGEAFKWKYGLHVARAWMFETPPLLGEIFGRGRFSTNAVTGIVPLTAEEADRVLTLARREIAVLQPSAAAAHRLGLPSPGRHSAPPPRTRLAIMHVRDRPAFTYAFKVEGNSGDAIKVGWAFDWKLRLRGFKQVAMSEIGGVRYSAHRFQLWDSARQAFRMEQTMLHRLADCRVYPDNSEMLRVDFARFEREWTAVLVELLGRAKAPS